MDPSIDWARKPIDYRPEYLGPRGSSNPVPINRFNVHDALEHHLVVITEGALALLEKEIYPLVVEGLPPHIRQQLPLVGALNTPLLGDTKHPLEEIEAEAASRIEELEKPMYEPYYDNPYRPWADEQKAAYEVDAVDGYVKRHIVPDEKEGEQFPGGWRLLE
jgi:hypothetical protein